MKQILLLAALIISSISNAQLQVHTVQVSTNDLVYDANTHRIYASIPSSNGENGNSIGIINPDNYILENTVFIGSEPTVLAISDNGQYIYSGFSGSSTVRRFDIATQSAGLQFSLGSDPSSGAFYVEDIEVMPGQETTIAISRKNNGFSPRHEGVVIYDDNVMRPTFTSEHTGSNHIEFTKENVLFGYNNESTEFGIRRMSVNSSGVSVLEVTSNILSGFGLDFIFYSNYMYSTDGKVIDVTAAPFVIGQFPTVNGPVAFDFYSNKVSYASYDYSGSITFKRFYPNTFLLFDSLPISEAVGPVKSLITCGTGCYAFNTADNQVIIIKDSSLDVPEFEPKNNISVFPNPTTEYFKIKSNTEIKEVELFDLNGRLISHFRNNFENIYVGNLNDGIYLIKIVDFNGNTSIKKLIKA